jgi:F-type H+-transporting ATPase subunit gamma
MSPNSADLKKQVSSAAQLQKVVSTMKLLSALNMTQFEQALLSLNTYSRAVALGLRTCWEAEFLDEPQSLGILVLGSAQGLVGQFNNAIAQYTRQTQKQIPVKNTNIWASGKRVDASLNNLGIHTASTLPPPDRVENIDGFIRNVFLQTNLLRENPAHHQFLVVYNHRFRGTHIPEASHSDLLPFSKLSTFLKITEPWPTRTTPEVIDNKDETLKGLVREFLYISLFRCCCESLAAENASRFATMERAEDNIKNHLCALTLTANQLRQDLIDAELFDVIR